MALMTVVHDVEEYDDYTVVHLTRKPGAMAPKMVQKMNARARAMVAAGVVDLGRGGMKQIERAIRNLDPEEIRGPTQVQRTEGRDMWIRVATG